MGNAEYMGAVSFLQTCFTPIRSIETTRSENIF